MPKPIQHSAGAVLIEQGETARDVFHVASGLVKLQRVQPDGQELIVGLRSSGWILGAAAAIVEKPYPATAITVTPCYLARIEASRFRNRVFTDRQLSWRIHRMHGEEIYEQAAAAADHKTAPARKRLERFLARWVPHTVAADKNGFVPVELPLRQWEIAQLIGVTPQYLCQLFAELEREGVAVWDRDHLTILHRLGDDFAS